MLFMPVTHSLPSSPVLLIPFTLSLFMPVTHKVFDGCDSGDSDFTWLNVLSDDTTHMLFPDLFMPITGISGKACGDGVSQVSCVRAMLFLSAYGVTGTSSELEKRYLSEFCPLTLMLK